MLSVLIYTVEAGVIFYLLNFFYGQVYDSLGYNKWNRVYLLLSVLASYLLPLLKVTYYYDSVPDTGPFRIDEVVECQGAQFITVDREMTLSLWWDNMRNSQLFEIPVLVLFAVYIAGVAVKLFTFLRGLYKTLRLRRNPVVGKSDGVTVYLTGVHTVAFSFFRNIFLGTKAKGLSQTDMRTVLSHEGQHIRGWHSLDTLLFGLMSVVQWFNPAVRKASRYSRLVCENIADCKASEGGALTDYSRLILSLGEVSKESTGKARAHSSLSERIMRLLDGGSDRARKVWFASTLPVLMLAVSAYIMWGGAFSKHKRGFDVPFDSDYILGTGYFENQIYFAGSGDVFNVSHRQADLVLEDDCDVLAPFDADVVSASPSELTLKTGSLQVTIGGFCVSAPGSSVVEGEVVGKAVSAGHPVYIKVSRDGKPADPRTVFKL